MHFQHQHTACNVGQIWKMKMNFLKTRILMHIRIFYASHENHSLNCNERGGLMCFEGGLNFNYIWEIYVTLFFAWTYLRSRLWEFIDIDRAELRGLTLIFLVGNFLHILLKINFCLHFCDFRGHFLNNFFLIIWNSNF